MVAKTDLACLWASNLSGIELFRAQLYNQAFAKHMHEEYTIGLNDSGLGHFTYRGASQVSYPSSFNLINPGEMHTGQGQGGQGWGFRNFYISTVRMDQLLAQMEWQGRPHFTQPVVVDEGLRSRFNLLFQALSTPTPKLAQESMLLGFLEVLVSHHSQSWKPRPSTPGRSQKLSTQSEPQAVAVVQAYLQSHSADPVSIADLAELVDLSPSYLIRSFRQQVGVPPHSYQRHWQLVKAKQALQTPQPLADIALEQGFYDQSHLNRAFKRAFGVTPGQYQRAILSKTDF